MELYNLSPKKGSRRNRKRLGRGNGSGHGKTSGRGNKGQLSRAGVSIPAWFEGGQMPFYRRIPKIGFISRKRVLGLNLYNTVKLSDLNRFDDGAVVDAAALKEKGLACKASLKAGIKVLGTGTLEKKLTLKVNAVTKGAKAQIEAKGGTIELLEKKANKVEAKSK